MDELKQCAVNFEKLIKHEYEIIAGSKQTLVRMLLFFSDIKERIELFAHLEEALDSNELMIKYKKGHTKGTLINATYVIVYRCKNEVLHYFIDEEDNTGRYYGKSFFGRKDNKFLENQQTFKILKKYKYNREDGTMQTLCDKPLREQKRKEKVSQK